MLDVIFSDGVLSQFSLGNREFPGITHTRIKCLENRKVWKIQA